MMMSLALSKLPSSVISRPVSMFSSVLSRSSSSSSESSYREEKIAVTDDGTIIACWHPPPKFPYSMTRPIPRSDKDGDVTSPLKVQVTEDMKELYHHKHERFHRRDLMRITWSTKHRWFPNRQRQWKEQDEKKNPREKPYM